MDYSIIEILRELKEDPSWCEDADLRNALVAKMTYFIIEN